MADSDHNSTPGKAPAFQFYASDFSSGTRALSAEEVGSYIRLLCYQWDKGSVPRDLELLARIAGVSLARMRRVWVRVSEHFETDPDNLDMLVNLRLERERMKQAAYRELQSKKGKASAANRTPTGRQPSLNRASTEPQPSYQPEGQPKPNSSISGLRSSDFRQKQEPRVSDEQALRAGDFLERYGDLHKKHRHGTPYIGKIHHDFQEALQLVSAYDDGRLDTLATVWLTTDHDFAENGTRTIAKFRSMISWCDERLRKAGL